MGTVQYPSPLVRPSNNQECSLDEMHASNRCCLTILQFHPVCKLRGKWHKHWEPRADNVFEASLEYQSLLRRRSQEQAIRLITRQLHFDWDRCGWSQFQDLCPTNPHDPTVFSESQHYRHHNPDPSCTPILAPLLLLSTYRKNSSLSGSMISVYRTTLYENAMNKFSPWLPDFSESNVSVFFVFRLL
jgi:hypothetical protein